MTGSSLPLSTSPTSTPHSSISTTLTLAPTASIRDPQPVTSHMLHPHPGNISSTPSPSHSPHPHTSTNVTQVQFSSPSPTLYHSTPSPRPVTGHHSTPSPRPARPGVNDVNIAMRTKSTPHLPPIHIPNTGAPALNKLADDIPATPASPYTGQQGQ